MQTMALNPNDVLLGRGAPLVKYPGNQQFRKFVRSWRSEYARTEKRYRKDEIARRIMNEVETMGGRFLKKVDCKREAGNVRSKKWSSKEWVEVDAETALLKVKQALRTAKENTEGEEAGNEQEDLPQQVGLFSTLTTLTAEGGRGDEYPVLIEQVKGFTKRFMGALHGELKSPQTTTELTYTRAASKDMQATSTPEGSQPEQPHPDAPSTRSDMVDQNNIHSRWNGYPSTPWRHGKPPQKETMTATATAALHQQSLSDESKMVKAFVEQIRNNGAISSKPLNASMSSSCMPGNALASSGLAVESKSSCSGVPFLGDDMMARRPDDLNTNNRTTNAHYPKSSTCRTLLQANPIGDDVHTPLVDDGLNGAVGAFLKTMGSRGRRSRTCLEYAVLAVLCSHGLPSSSTSKHVEETPEAKTFDCPKFCVCAEMKLKELRVDELPLAQSQGENYRVGHIPASAADQTKFDSSEIPTISVALLGRLIEIFVLSEIVATPEAYARPNDGGDWLIKTWLAGEVQQWITLLRINLRNENAQSLYETSLLSILGYKAIHAILAQVAYLSHLRHPLPSYPPNVGLQTQTLGTSNVAEGLVAGLRR